MMVKAGQCVIAIIFAGLILQSESVRPEYQHFEDYLNSLDSNDQTWLSDAKTTMSPPEPEDQDSEDLFKDSTSTSTTTEAPTTTAAPQLSIQQTREVTCCLMGQLAGDKGYHCYVQYYAARLLMRNRNRAHNRKMHFYGREKIPHYGEKVMRTFEQCVNGMGAIFHKCCHLASQERRPPTRYDTVHRTRSQRKHDQLQSVNVESESS